MNLVVRNYIRSFKWQNIKDSYHNGNWSTLLFLMIFLPIDSWDNLGTHYSSIINMLIIFPNFFVMFTVVLFPMVLPKLIYLCPMSKEMRKEYILKACFIRIIVPIILNLLAVTILLLTGLTTWVYAMGILINNITYAVFFGSCSNINVLGNSDGKKQLSISSSLGFMEFIMVLAGMIFCTIYSTISASVESTKLWIELLIIGINILICLPITLNYLKYWPSAVENALSYETSTAKPTKLKK